MKLQLKSNIDDVLRDFAEVSEKKIPTAIVRALNTAARRGKTAATKASVAVTGFPPRLMKNRVRGVSGNSLASKSRMSVVLYLNFEKGVKASLAIDKKKLAKFAVKNGFLVTLESGKRSIFERTGKAKRPTKSGSYKGRILKRGPRKGQLITREPIDEVRLPLHPHATRAATRAWTTTATPAFEKELVRQLTRVLNK